jgi:hypothetical protein
VCDEIRRRIETGAPAASGTAAGDGRGAGPREPLPNRVPFEELSRGGRLVLIRYGDQEYRLTLTRAGKLVLTK